MTDRHKPRRDYMRRLMWAKRHVDNMADVDNIPTYDDPEAVVVSHILHERVNSERTSDAGCCYTETISYPCIHGNRLIRDGEGSPWRWEHGPCAGCAKNTRNSPFAGMLATMLQRPVNSEQQPESGGP